MTLNNLLLTFYKEEISMLKTLEQEQMWLVTQADHVRVSGYLAAHIYDLKDGKVIRFRQFADTKPIWDTM